MSTNNQEIFSALNAELDVERIDWEPTTAGERIVGLVKGVEYVSIREGAEMMGVLTLETPSGALARVAAGAKNLRGQLEAAKVQPGDGLAIKYEGKREGRNGGREFNAYVVATQAVGERKPSEAFKVPEASGDDLGLVPGAADPWTSDTAQQDGPRF